GPGTPQLAAQADANTTGWVSLSDSGLAHFNHKSQFIHYGITAIQTSDSVIGFGNFDWSMFTQRGLVESRTLTVTMTSSPTQTSSISPTSSSLAGAISPNCAPVGGVSTDVVPAGCGNCAGMPSFWSNAGTQEQWTTIGEVHATDAMSAVFDYGTSSSSTLQTGA